MRRWATVVLVALAPLAAAQTQFASPPDWVVRLHLDQYNTPWFGLLGWQWAGLAILLGISLLLGHWSRQAATVMLRARYKFPGLEFSQSSKRGTRRAAATLVAALIWSLVLPSLSLPGEPEILVFRIVQIVSSLALIWLVVSLWNACCDIFVHRSESIDERTERLLVPVTRKLVTAVIIVGGIFAVLAALGVPILSYIAYLGIGGLAIALAAKDSVENVFGSLTILFDMPFALGDWVKIDRVEGIVEQINLRSTKIRTFEDSMITLPNSNLIKASVENFGARRFRRQKFTLRLSHESEADQVEKFCEDLRAFMKTADGLAHDKTVVELNEITEQWIGVLVICYLDAAAPVDELRVRSGLMAQALRLARKRDLKFAAGMPLPGSVDSGTPGQAETVLPKVE